MRCHIKAVISSSYVRSSYFIVIETSPKETEQDATSATDLAAAAGARCHGDGRRSSRQLHGTAGDQRRSAAAARRSARLREDWVGGDDGRP